MFPAPVEAVPRRVHAMNRTLLVAGLALAGLLPLAPGRSQPAPAPPDDLTDAAASLHREAAGLARKGASPPQLDLPPALAALDYDGYRSIRRRPGTRLWEGTELPFQVEPLHPGGRYVTPVQIALATDGAEVRGVPYAAGDFVLPEGLSATDGLEAFAGMRLFSPLRQPDRFDEVLVLHGASYFRAVGRDHVFGTSARALAIDTAAPAGEEFPAFTRFVLEEPAPGDGAVVVHGLAHSRSAAAVLSARVVPGEETTMDCTLTVYPTRDLDTAGIAPLTSMFLLAEGRGRPFDDHRAAVHDADGLQMVTGSGERLWRPLSNGRSLQVSAFSDEDPRGFGLTQRRRGFMRYGDPEARYDLRPSVWVEPVGEPWGRGAVVLVEIPTETEFNDNVVAFWRPEEPLRKGEPRRFRYRLRWCTSPPDRAALARVVETRTGLAPDDGARLFTIDFEGECLRDVAGLTVDAGASVSGEVLSARCERLPAEAGAGPVVRVSLKFAPEDDGDVAELGARLLNAAGESVSERWMHRWVR